MSNKFILTGIFVILCEGLFAQGSVIQLTFTSVDNSAYVKLDSVQIMNRTQGSDTVLYWPDTVLSLVYSNLPESLNNFNTFNVLQNYPNPVTNQTSVSLYIPQRNTVRIIITDIHGRTVFKNEMVLDKGKQSFRFTPGNSSLYFFTACWHEQSSSIKILRADYFSDQMVALEYTGSEDHTPQLKTIGANKDFYFTPGDKLLCIGYADTLQSGLLDAPLESTTYSFQFATNVSCPATPTVEYEGKVYHTVQIFNQCWIKENLNAGDRINGTIEQSNNGILEKYCYENSPDSCEKYGGLYQWNEMMQYTTEPGQRGICPPDWHIPTDEEWKLLEGSIDSQYGIGNIAWDDRGNRGYDAGIRLKATSGWKYEGNGSDLFGFSGLPGGYRGHYGHYYEIGSYGYWYTSTDDYYDLEWSRSLGYYNSQSYRFNFNMEKGFSVRCIRDY